MATITERKTPALTPERLSRQMQSAYAKIGDGYRQLAELQGQAPLFGQQSAPSKAKPVGVTGRGRRKANGAGAQVS